MTSTPRRTLPHRSKHLSRAGVALAAGMVVFLFWPPPAVRAVTAPQGFVVENAYPTALLSFPVALAFLPDGRALVAQKGGLVWMIAADGTQYPNPFLNLAQVEDAADMGLLGLAVDPDFETSPWVYVGYTAATGLDDRYSRVERYRVDDMNPNVADLASRQFLAGETWPEGIPTLHTTHTIGALRFGPDKTLLVAHGDGGHFEVADSGGLDPGGFIAGRTDPAEDLGAFRAQTLNSLAGKILRLDKETGLGLPSNPYWDGDPTSDRSKVWVYGLRNPFRFTVRPGTGSTNPNDGDPGTLYIADVGWHDWEEVSVSSAGGENFGWPCIEGPVANTEYQEIESTAAGNSDVLCGAGPSSENPESATGPVLWWNHSAPSSSNPPGETAISVSGGVFYSGTGYPSGYAGRLFLADFVRSWIITAEMDSNDTLVDWDVFSDDAGNPVDLQTHPLSGNVYFVSISFQRVYRIVAPNSDAPAHDTPATEEAGAGLLEVRSFPNPFGGSTYLELRTAREMKVGAAIYDAAGRLVRTVLPTGWLPEGRHQRVWDGRDDDGRLRPNGVYLLRVHTGEGAQHRQIVLDRR